MTAQAQAAARRLQGALGKRITAILEDGRGVVVRVETQAIRDALGFLKADRENPFEMLASIAAVDWSTWREETGQPPPGGRFGLVYNLVSVSTRTRLFLETFVGEGEIVPSAVPHYASADWSEREVFDMFGIRFRGHPDLRRIYLKDDFEGHPLRKDFPRHGRNPQDHPQE